MTAVLTPPLPPAATALQARPPTEGAPGVPVPRPWLGAVVARWPAVLALASFAAYIAVGCFLLYSVHYAIGDALARSEDARAVLFSRDPHLAAWGFVWFPGPVAFQLPFMLVVSPLGQAALAGPLSTATCGALTVLVLVKLLRRLGLNEAVVAGLTLTYCLSPVVVFYAANGMSEASFYLVAAVFLLGTVWWYQEGGSRPLILVSMGLGAAMTIRYEAMAIVPVVSVLVALRERGWRRRAKVATLVAFPGLFVFALWTVANWLVMGDALFWYHGQSLDGTPPAHAAWLPVHKTLATGLAYAARYSWAFVPALFIVLPVLVLVVWSRRRRSGELATVVGAALVLPGQVALLLEVGKTWGDARYFASLTIFATVTLGLAAREVTTAGWLRPAGRRALCAALVGLGALNAVSGTLNDLNPKKTAVESEYVAFRSVFGFQLPPGSANVLHSPPMVRWQRFDSYIDPYLAQGQMIMADTSTGFPAVLFSAHPGQWVVPSDGDFQKLAENFSGQFQWLLEAPPGRPSAPAIEIAQTLSSTEGGHWQKARDFGAPIGELYRWAPDRVPSGSSPGA